MLSEEPRGIEAVCHSEKIVGLQQLLIDSAMAAAGRYGDLLGAAVLKYQPEVGSLPLSQEADLVGRAAIVAGVRIAARFGALTGLSV